MSEVFQIMDLKFVPFDPAFFATRSEWERVSDFSQVNIVGLGYEFVNFGAKCVLTLQNCETDPFDPAFFATRSHLRLDLQGYLAHKKHPPPRTLQ
jgi:hypothetical protein